VESDDGGQPEVVGVLCGKPGPIWQGCCPNRKQRPSKGKKDKSKAKGVISETAKKDAASGALLSEFGEHRISLWHATVHPKFRNHGVASLLLRAAETWAREIGASKVEVMSLNTEAKAVCYNVGYKLLNERTGRLPLVPAALSKSLS